MLFRSDPQKGIPLTLPDPGHDEIIYHAGTTDSAAGLVSSGGRVLAVTAVADTLNGALGRAYTLADRVDFPGAQLRRDIGARIGAAPDPTPV